MQIDENDRFSGVFVTQAEKCMAMMTTTIHKLETSWVLSWLYHFLNLWWISLSPIRTIQEHCYGDKWFVSNSQCKHSTLVTWCDDTLLFYFVHHFLRSEFWILISYATKQLRNHVDHRIFLHSLSLLVQVLTIQLALDSKLGIAYSQLRNLIYSSAVEIIHVPVPKWSKQMSDCVFEQKLQLNLVNK